MVLFAAARSGRAAPHALARQTSAERSQQRKKKIEAAAMCFKKKKNTSAGVNPQRKPCPTCSIPREVPHGAPPEVASAPSLDCSNVMAAENQNHSPTWSSATIAPLLEVVRRPARPEAAKQLVNLAPHADLPH